MRKLAVLVCLLVARAAAADDACTLDGGVFTSQIDPARLPKGARLGKPTRAPHAFRETVELPDGRSVTLEISGCAHLGVMVDVRDAKRVTATTSVAAATALLTTTLADLPLRADATLRPSLFADGLRRAQATKFPVSLPCGDATCALELLADPPRLHLAYDFAL